MIKKYTPVYWLIPAILFLGFAIPVTNAQTAAHSKATANKTAVKQSASAGSYQNDAPQMGRAKWVAGDENMPGHLQAFQENKGQFLNLIKNDWVIKYGCDDGGTQVLFTNKGLLYYLPERIKVKEKEDSKDRDKLSKDADEQDKESKEYVYKTIYHKVAIGWEKSNPDVTIEALDKTPYYFGSVDPTKFGGIDNIPGYKKLIYHNLYPGIDVEFTFHKDKGIEYALKVKPGYDASVFKMRYYGAQGLLFDASGNLHIKTSMGDIIDHSPKSNQEGQAIASSFKLLSDKEVGFTTGKINPSEELVIDPWLVSPIALPYIPSDCEMDANNNLYVLEWSAGSMYEQKYTSVGVLSWTYSMTQYGSNSSISDMTIDPATGTTYTPEPYYYFGNPNVYAMISLTSSGTLNYFYNSYSGTNGTVFETWNVGYSCEYGKLAIAGSPTVLSEETGIVNKGTGNFTGTLYTNASISELYAGTIAPNGTYYCISSNTCFCTTSYTQSLVSFNIAGVSPTQNWAVGIPNYDFADFAFKEPGGIPNNGIGASCSDVYTSDGVNLNEYDANTGANVKFGVAIPGGSNTLGTVNSGVAVDPICGDVYVGSSTAIEVFDKNCAFVTSYATPGIVYDLDYDNSTIGACGATNTGKGFVGEYTAEVCHIPITHTDAICSPTGTATANPTFCAGPYTYLWSPGGQTTQTITGLTSGTYTVTVGTSISCVTFQDTVTILNKPGGFTLTMTQTNDKCFGSSNGTATVTPAGGYAPYTYVWAPSGGANATATNLSAGTYTVSVTDSTGCVVLDSVIITQPLAIKDSITTIPSDCGQSDGSANVSASGGTGGTYTYLWSPSGGTDSTASNISSGTYTVSITDSNGCSVTAQAVVPSIGGPTITITAHTDISCYGLTDGSVTTNTVGGTLPYTYAWTPSGGTNANASNLSIGTYTVTVNDSAGCISFTSITITQPPQLRDSITATVNVLCFSDSTGKLTVGTKGGTLPYTYSWSPSGGSNDTASNLSAGSYAVNITDKNGCTVSASGIITQPTALTLTAAGFPTACYGDSNGQATVIPAGGTGTYKYNWSPKGGTNANASNLSAGTYTVTVTDANGCTHDTAVVVSQPTQIRDSVVSLTNVLCNGGNNGSIDFGVAGGTPTYTYKWNNGQTNATATSLKAGTYTITITDANGCTKIDSATITQPTALAITTTTAILCIGQSDTLKPVYKGGTPAYTYNWVPNTNLSCTTCADPVASPTTTTVYTVTVTDANGCVSAPITDTVIVAPPLKIVAGTSQAICPGDSAHLTSSASGGNKVYTYTWKPSAGLSCTNCQNPGASPKVTTTYTVVVNDGCSTPPDSATVTITVNPLPVVSFSADTLSGCAPVCTDFKDMTTIASGNVASWAWNFGDGNNDNTQNPTHCYTNPGKYTVTLTVTSDSGCTSKLTIPNMISVFSYPVAAFDMSPQPTTILSPTITFTDKSTDAYGIASWLWNFGDFADIPSILENPTYTYQDTGTFCTTLTVTNIHGCKDSITECLVISPIFTLYIPDAFSPNGDGVNDIFAPRGTFIHDFKMYIFDRWGMLLYSTTDINKGWNGAVKNGSTVCQEDTYVYLITCLDNFDNKHSYIGKVTLIK